MDQLWSGDRALYEKLQKDTTPLGKERLHYFWLNKGPWSDLDGHKAFLPGVPERKPAGRQLLSRGHDARGVRSVGEDAAGRAAGTGRGLLHGDPPRTDGKLTAVPYSQAYAADLKKAAGLLREAAALTDNASLRKFLTLRADAFLSNDYYASDVAWMDLDAPLDITIGPYETYNDELFGYKAGFEAYITIRDDKETDRLKNFSSRLQEVENNLPDRREVPQPEAGRLGADPRGQRSLRRRRRRARCPHRRLQPAQRRARGARKGHRSA